MKSTIIVLIFTNFLYFSAQALSKLNKSNKKIFLFVCVILLDCNNNPCALGGYFSRQRGYQCIQMNTEALCTCPNGGYEMNQPCRMRRKNNQ